VLRAMSAGPSQTSSGAGGTARRSPSRSARVSISPLSRRSPSAPRRSVGYAGEGAVHGGPTRSHAEVQPSLRQGIDRDDVAGHGQRRVVLKGRDERADPAVCSHAGHGRQQIPSCIPGMVQVLRECEVISNPEGVDTGLIEARRPSEQLAYRALLHQQDSELKWHEPP
jgi:hypothetical protein